MLEIRGGDRIVGAQPGNGLHAFGELFGGVHVGHPAVAVQRGAAHGGILAAGHPQRRAGPLDRRWVQGDVVEGVEPAVEGHLALVPESADHLHGLGGARTPFPDRHPAGLELGRKLAADADTAQIAAVGHHIQHRAHLGRQGRGIEGQQRDGAHQTDVLRGTGGSRQLHKGIADRPVEHDVLTAAEHVEAQLFRAAGKGGGVGHGAQAGPELQFVTHDHSISKKSGATQPEQ